jgi:hypothetical protein
MRPPPFPLRTLAIGLAAGSFLLSSCTQTPKQGAAVGTGSDQPAPAPAKPQQRSDYPLATRIEGKKSQVISPYKPHNIIDVKGFRSGQLARDPSTAPIDPTSGKPDMSQSKIFELP